jgi:hypothetical protein
MGNMLYLKDGKKKNRKMRDFTGKRSLQNKTA